MHPRAFNQSGQHVTNVFDTAQHRTSEQEVQMLVKDYNQIKTDLMKASKEIDEAYKSKEILQDAWQTDFEKFDQRKENGASGYKTPRKIPMIGRRVTSRARKNCTLAEMRRIKSNWKNGHCRLPTRIKRLRWKKRRRIM